jgi:uncharacterized protein YjbJ (UPF0337 family)
MSFFLGSRVGGHAGAPDGRTAPPPTRLDAEQCQKSADECRRLARTAKDPSHRIMLEQMAASWERMANSFRTGKNPPNHSIGALCSPARSPSHTQENTMDKDRIKGAAEQAKGKVKEVAGRVAGDSKLESEGKADQVAGKVQNAIGGIKDTLRGK